MRLNTPVLIAALLTTAPAFADTPVTPVASKWNAALYGFAEFDAIGDSSQSFNDLAGNANIARPGTYAGDHGRLTFGVRNSRIGFKVAAPEYKGVRAIALLEMDFLGNQPPTATESATFTSPTFRIRHFWLKLENPIVDVLIGQNWQLFGWQSYFHPNTVEIQGVPGQIYSRSPQVRLSHTFKSDPINVEIAIAGSRPPQRDSFFPDGQAGIRLFINKLKGLHTMGSTSTAIDPAAVGVSGVLRRFALPEFTASPKNNVETLGWGVSVDAMVPIIPASPEKRGNSLTLNGSYVLGQGISDLFTGLTGGIAFPGLPNPANANPAPTYTADIDNGLVTYDAVSGALNTIDWQAFLVGFQYYFPGEGTVWISGNFSQMDSDNIKNYAAATGTTKKIFNQSRFASGSLFWDVTPAVRLGASYSFYRQTYVDGVTADNHRGQLSAFYIF
jgi:hypothetical protein